MATNLVYDSLRGLSLVASDPASPTSSSPVRVGRMCGVAIIDEESGGSTSIDFGPAVYDLSVKGTDDAGNVAVSVGDLIYYVDADTPKLSKKASGHLFGVALEAVTSGSTTTIQVAIGGAAAANESVGHFLDIKGEDGQHLDIQTIDDNVTVRLNSRNYAQASGSSIGFQAKPAQNVTSTGSVIGGEISPRANDGIAVANVIGLHVDTYLKGTTGNISGDVRGMQIELVTDDAGTRTVSGDLIGLRFRAAWSGTITGDMVAIKIEKAEAQTNSKQWEYVFELEGDNALIWGSGYTTEASSENGSFKVRINGADRWVKTYDTAPS